MRRTLEEKVVERAWVVLGLAGREHYMPPAWPGPLQLRTVANIVSTAACCGVVVVSKYPEWVSESPWGYAESV